jgi:gamma-butyrobetaine dioxygenase
MGMVVIEPRVLPVWTAEVAGRGILLRSGARSAELHALWLRDQSIEPGQIDPSNRQRLFTPRDLDPDLAVLACSLIGDVLTVELSDGHRVRLPLPVVAGALGWVDDPEEPPAPRSWTGGPEPFPLVDWGGIGWADGDDSDEHLLDALDALHRHGFVVFEGLPTAEGTVRRVANRLGYLVPTNFGDIFDVRVEPHPVDLAYTSIELLAHTDLPYRRPVPGLQLLHCLANEAPGGDSTLVDGLAMWESIRAEEPELCRALCDVEVVYRYDIGSDTVVNRASVLEQDRAGRFRRIHFNTKLDTPHPVPGADIDRWYRGRRWLLDWLNDPEHRLHFRLRPGDLVCFDNHRLLHGRTAFDRGAGRRHLQGCYIEHDGPDRLRRLAHRRTVIRP